VALSYVYIYSSANPSSSITTAVHASYASWVALLAFLPIILVGAACVDTGILIVLANSRERKSCCLTLLAVLIGFTPVWLPYVLQVVLRNQAYNNACDGFDGVILVDAVSSTSAGLSVANFPAVFGGAKWQLYQSAHGTYNFAPVGENSPVTINLVNNTYGSGVNGTFTDNPLSFPELGLYSTGSWTRSCFAPAVDLKDANGREVVKTGLTVFTDCSQLQICASKTLGDDAVYIAVARILIALQNAVGCCMRKNSG